MHFSNNNHISDGSAQVDQTIIMVSSDVSTSSDGAISSAWYVKQLSLLSIKQVLWKHSNPLYNNQGSADY